ncbi:hypothetical protein ABPG77_008754 [Micractinium sp. CCAP 211/92]
MKLGDRDSAQDDLTLALYHKPRDAKAWLRRATIFLESGFLDAAIAAKERAELLDEAGRLGARKQLPDLQRTAALSDSPVPPIVALCGSHIANSARLGRLPQMVRSWYIQQYAIPLRISLSFDSTYEKEVMGEVTTLLHSYPGLTVSLSDAPLSQGQHYKRLVRQLQEEGWDGRGTWLLLTDDDDIWHPRRSLAYADSQRQLLSDPSRQIAGTVLSVCSSLYIDAAKNHSITSAFCVDRLHRSATATCTNITLHGPERAERGEAWCYSMRLCTLAQFFVAAEPCVVSHVFWDMCLIKFLRWGNKYKTYFITKEQLRDNWMYFYRRDEAVGPASRALAKSTSLPSMVRHNLELFCATRFNPPADTFADFVAERTLDAKLKRKAAAMGRKMQRELLSDADSVPNKLLHSPRCQPSHHA